MGIGRAAGASGHVAVLVVDGLSFCTAVEVAVGQDASVLPFTFGGLAAARAGTMRPDAASMRT